MKAIYLILGNKVYRLNQDTRIPNVLEYIPAENKSSINTDEALKTVVETLEFSTMETSGIKSNGQKFNDLKTHLVNNKVTQIYNLYNRFKIAIDYSLNNGVCELSRNIVIKDMTANDAAILLGVGTNSECVYRRVKDLKAQLDFGITVPVPLGITSPGTKEYRLTIHDISFYADTQPYLGNIHNSIYETPCGCSAYKSTVSQNLKDFTLLYSTSVEGLSIQDLKIKFMPRKVSLDILLTYAGLIVAYDDKEIDKIIVENIRHKYHPSVDPHTDPENPDGIVVPDSDYLPDADGSTKPDKHGWYDFWERCNSTTPYARLVVEDLTPDAVYDQQKMVKMKKILKDIPDIQIGEYVHYVEAVDEDHGHHHHHHCHCDDDIHVIPADEEHHHHHHHDEEEEPDVDPTPVTPEEPEEGEPSEVVPDTSDEPTEIDDKESSSGTNDPQQDQINSLFAHLGAHGSNADIELISVDEIDVN